MPAKGRCKLCTSLHNLVNKKVRLVSVTALPDIINRFGDPAHLTAALRHTAPEEERAQLISELQDFLLMREHVTPAQTAAAQAAAAAAPRTAGAPSANAAEAPAPSQKPLADPGAAVARAAGTAPAADQLGGPAPAGRAIKSPGRKRSRSGSARGRDGSADAVAQQRAAAAPTEARSEAGDAAAASAAAPLPPEATACAAAPASLALDPAARMGVSLDDLCQGMPSCDFSAELERLQARSTLWTEAVQAGQTAASWEHVCHVCAFTMPATSLHAAPERSREPLMRVNPLRLVPATPEELRCCCACAGLLRNGMQRAGEFGVSEAQIVCWVKDWMHLQVPAPWFLHDQADHWRFARFDNVWQWPGMNGAAQAAARRERARAELCVAACEAWLAVDAQDTAMHGDDPGEWWSAMEMKCAERIKAAAASELAWKAVAGASTPRGQGVAA